MADGEQGRVRRRARSRRLNRYRWLSVAALLVLFVTGVVGVSARSGLLASAAARLPWSRSTPPCPPTHVSVLTAPEIAATVHQLVAPLNGHHLLDGSCLAVDLNSENPAATAAHAASDPVPDLPHVWIPDSSLWIGQVRAWPVQPVGSFATSPVIIAGSRTGMDHLGWSRRPPTWQEALDARRVLIAPGVTNDAAFLSALLALAGSQGSVSAAGNSIPGALLAASRAPDASLGAAIPLAQAPSPSAPLILTSQQRLLEAVRGGSGPTLVTVRPRGAPAGLDYPVTRVRPLSEDPVVAAGADLVVGALTAPATRAVIQAAGLGPPAGSQTTRPGQSAQSGRPAQSAQSAQAAQAAHIQQFVDRVRALAAPSSTLLVMDVSLSMGDQVRRGLNRIQLASQVGIGAVHIIPGTSNAGLWTFAGRSRRGPYRQVVPIDLLNAPEQGQTHADTLTDTLGSLPRQLTPGGTALYDTALAALRAVRASYQEGGTNDVVLFTDGKNDYDGGLTLHRFVRAVRADAQAHPKQQVSLIAIGIGRSADMKALWAMTAASGGSAFQANDERGLKNALFSSLAQRSG